MTSSIKARASILQERLLFPEDNNNWMRRNISDKRPLFKAINTQFRTAYRTLKPKIYHGTSPENSLNKDFSKTFRSKGYYSNSNELVYKSDYNVLLKL